MKNLVAFTCLLALCAAVSAYPQRPKQASATSTTGRPTTSKSINPNVNVIRQGMIEKLCSQKYKTSASSTIKTPTAGSQRVVREAQAPTHGPTCSDFDKLSFSELVERVKGGLRPVNGRP